jgi:hypothetical protein
MKTQHTPGPWRWERRWATMHDSDSKGVALLLVTDHRPIPLNDPVIFALRDDWRGDLSAEREAAKSLIAAAPDLLEALKGALASLEVQAATARNYAAACRDEKANTGLADEIERNIAAYRKAIDKAEGRLS